MQEQPAALEALAAVDGLAVRAETPDADEQIVAKPFVGKHLGGLLQPRRGAAEGKPRHPRRVEPGEQLRVQDGDPVEMPDLHPAANGFRRSTVIVPGQTIKVPSSSSARVAATGRSYVVKAGDSLGRIAANHGVSLASLLEANGFEKTSVIVPGQSISLPDAAVMPQSAPPVMSRADKIVDFARAQVGKPYQSGAVGPDAFDCSGLVVAAFRQIGIRLPHQSLQQSQLGTAIDWMLEDVRPGDLVFTFSSSNPTQISHVGIAISATEWIEAPFTGATVRIARLPSDSRIQAVRRFVVD